MYNPGFTIYIQCTMYIVCSLALCLGEQDAAPGGAPHQEPEDQESRHGHLPPRQSAQSQESF